jgi:hypothetical protein
MKINALILIMLIFLVNLKFLVRFIGLLIYNSGKLSHTVSCSKSKRDKYQLVADLKLKELYPKVVGKEIAVHVQPPSLGGHLISNTPEKFCCKIGAKSEIEVC